MRIAITGGSGLVGGHLTTQLRAIGHAVTPLGRGASPTEAFGNYWARCIDAPALIHAGWDLANPEANVANSVRLFQSAQAAGVSRILFISSLSAFEGCRSRYGAAKLAVEKAVAAIGGCSVRLGFVCDDSSRGLSGSLKKLARLPVIPLPGGGRQNLFTIRAEDLAQAFLQVLEHYDGEPVNLAYPEPVSLAGMMHTFARQQRTRAVFLPVPWRMLWAPLRAAEAAGVNIKFRSDSLVSLMNQNPAPDFRRLVEWGIVLRAFSGDTGLK
jgi:nucleoside-diphosphate-sugar epimerase